MKIKVYLPSGKVKILTANNIVDVMIIDLEYKAWEYL